MRSRYCAVSEFSCPVHCRLFMGSADRHLRPLAPESSQRVCRDGQQCFINATGGLPLCGMRSAWALNIYAYIGSAHDDVGSAAASAQRLLGRPVHCPCPPPHRRSRNQALRPSPRPLSTTAMSSSIQTERQISQIHGRRASKIS